MCRCECECGVPCFMVSYFLAIWVSSAGNGNKKRNEYKIVLLRTTSQRNLNYMCIYSAKWISRNKQKLAWHGIEIGSVHRMCGISHKAIWNNVLELFCLDVVEFLFGSPSSCVAIFVYVLRTKKWMEEFVRCTISLLCYATDTHNETVQSEQILLFLFCNRTPWQRLSERKEKR